MGYVTWPRPFQAHFVIRRVGLAMFNNPHIKFEMSTITCNEEIKGNAKCKNSRFEPPFGGLMGNAQGSSMARWKACCRLLLAILFSLALTAVALLSEICLNRRFPTGWVTLSANFRWMGTSPANHLWTVRERNDVATTLPLQVFTQRNFAADLCAQKLKFTGKNSKIAFCATLWGS